MRLGENGGSYPTSARERPVLTCTLFQSIFHSCTSLSTTSMKLRLLSVLAGCAISSLCSLDVVCIDKSTVELNKEKDASFLMSGCRATQYTQLH